MTHDPNQLELFDHWPNAVGDLYITVEGYTETGICLRLQDFEGATCVTLEPGDSLYTHEGAWTFFSVDAAPAESVKRRSVFSRA